MVRIGDRRKKASQSLAYGLKSKIRYLIER